MRIIVALALSILGVFPQGGAAEELYDPRALRAQLSSGDWNARRVALVRLAPTLKLDQRKADFLPLFDDPHYQVRETAIELLYGTQDSTLIDPLLVRCADEHPDVREAAVGTLGAFGQPRVAQAVATCIDDAFVSVRRRAIAYFKAHDSAVGRAALVESLSDDDALNRLRAVEALTGHGAVEAVEALVRRLVHDPDPRVRREAARAFLAIDSRDGLLAVARALAHEPDASVRSSFVFTLRSRTHQDFGEDAQAWLGWFAEETSR